MKGDRRGESMTRRMKCNMLKYSYFMHNYADIFVAYTIVRQ